MTALRLFGIGPHDPPPDLAPDRSRHPSGRAWRPDRDMLVRRMAERAAARGAPWPRVVGAVVVLRGLLGVDRPTFAARVGLEQRQVVALEEGRVAPADVPDCLRRVQGVIDWAWIDGDPGRTAGDPPA